MLLNMSDSTVNSVMLIAVGVLDFLPESAAGAISRTVDVMGLDLLAFTSRELGKSQRNPSFIGNSKHSDSEQTRT